MHAHWCFWSSLFSHIIARVENEEITIIAAIKYYCHDETPLNLRIPNKGELKDEKKSATCKVYQSVCHSALSFGLRPPERSKS